MKITIEMLRARGACDTEEFEYLFGEEVEVTMERCLEAVRAGLDMDWAAENLFPAPAWKIFERAISPAREAHRKVRDHAVETRERAIINAWETFERATAPAEEIYNMALAQAFYAASKIQEEQ